MTQYAKDLRAHRMAEERASLAPIDRDREMTDPFRDQIFCSIRCKGFSNLEADLSLCWIMVRVLLAKTSRHSRKWQVSRDLDKERYVPVVKTITFPLLLEIKWKSPSVEII